MHTIPGGSIKQDPPYTVGMLRIRHRSWRHEDRGHCTGWEPRGGALRVDTPRDDYAATIDAIVTIVADLERTVGARGTVGVGIPGTISVTGLVKNANSTWLLGRPLKADLDARLAREVRIANDANCFAVSEAADGAAAGADVVFGVIVGTGTGAGITVRGRILTGPNGIAGEWGHNPLPWADDDEVPGPSCYCGKHGCVETFLSGPGLTRDHERSRASVVAASEIAAFAPHRAIPRPSETMVSYEHRMARALAGVINVLDPDVIVLGGGLSNIDRLYDNVPRLWSAYVFSAGVADTPRTRFVCAAHGDASGVRGAAWLWQQLAIDPLFHTLIELRSHWDRVALPLVAWRLCDPQSALECPSSPRGSYRMSGCDSETPTTPTPAPAPTPAPVPAPPPPPPPAPAALESITISPSIVTGQTRPTATVRLTAPAPAGNAPIFVETTNSDVAKVPANISVAAGETTNSFAIDTSTVRNPRPSESAPGTRASR